MGLETGTYVDDLVATNPLNTDVKSQGDDHFRLIKSVLKATFPDATRAFQFETVLSKTTTYPVVLADDRSFIIADATSGAFDIDLPLLSAVHDGYYIYAMKIDAGANAVTLDGNGAETINGGPTLALSSQYSAALVFKYASGWLALPIVPNPVGAALTQTLTNKTLSSPSITGTVGGGAVYTSPVLTTPQINDTSLDHQYIVAVNELTADRTITLPLLTGNDTFVFADFIQTLQNKTINLANNTLTGTLAQFNTACSDEDFTPHGKLDAVNAQTGTTYTLALTDAGDVVTMNNASANTVTIPLNSSVAFPLRTWITIIQIGAGATTISGAVGVTVNGVSAGSVAVPSQYASFATLLKVATDTWYLSVSGVA